MAAIPRFAPHAVLTLGEDVPVPYPRELISLLESGAPPARGRFPAGHFHTGEELAAEMAGTGLLDVEVHAVEGPAGLALEELAGSDPEVVAAALTLVRRVGTIPGLRDMTCHLMGIGRVA